MGVAVIYIRRWAAAIQGDEGDFSTSKGISGSWLSALGSTLFFRPTAWDFLAQGKGVLARRPG